MGVRRSFPPEFKAEVVALREVVIAASARSVGIWIWLNPQSGAGSQERMWMRAGRDGMTSAEHAEIAALRKRVRVLEEEREI